MAATVAGTSRLSRRKSTMRRRRLWPPPRNQDVVWPLLLRPPVRFLGAVSDFSGRCFVISSKVRVLMKRRPGEVGENSFSGIVSGLLEELDHLFALLQHDEGLLPVGPVPGVAALALQLAVHVGHAHRGHLHAEQALHRLLDRSEE